MTGLKLAPSILTADFGRLADEVRTVGPHVDWFHLDVMDGHYVPNLTFGASTVAAIRKACDHPLHVHLMIEDPAQYAASFVDAGADRISFHPEVVEDSAAMIDQIKSLGAGAGMAIHPDVPLDVARDHLADLDVLLVMTVRPGFGGQAYLSEVTPKIAAARAALQEAGVDADLEVDGGVNLSTVDAPVKAGANILVAGSAVFDGKDPGSAARRMRERLDGLGANRDG